MSLRIQDQDNILHRIMRRWTMRSEVINAMGLKEVVNLKDDNAEVDSLREEGQAL